MTSRGKEILKARAKILSGNPSQSEVRRLLGSSSKTIIGKSTPILTDPFESNQNISSLGKPRSIPTSSGGFEDLNSRDPFDISQVTTPKQYDKGGLARRRLAVESDILKRKQKTERAQLKLLEDQEKSINKAKTLEKRKRIGLGIAVAAPFISGAITSQLGDSKSAQRVGRGVESLSSGLAIASITGFNPLGIAAGALVTAFSFLKKEADADVKTFEDLKKSAEGIIATNQEQSDAIKNTVQAQNTLSGLLKSNSSIEERSRARQAVLSSASGVKDNDIRELLLSGDTSKAAQDKLFKFQQGLQQSSRAQEGLLVARKVAEVAAKDKGLFGIPGLFRSTDGNRKDFGVENIDAFISPLIDSIDLASLSSGKAAGAMERLNKGTIDGAEFFRILGDNLSVSKEVADGASKEFENLAGVLTTDSQRAIEEQILAQIRYKKSLEETSRSLSKAEDVSIRFKSAFNASIVNLIKKFNFENFSQSATAGNAIDVNRAILGSRREAGSVSDLNFIEKSFKLDQQEIAKTFSDKSNELFNEALKPIVEKLQGSISLDKQGEILEAVNKLFKGKGSFSEVSELIKQGVKIDSESEVLLDVIKNSNKDLGEQAAKLQVEQNLALDKLIALSQLQLNALTKGPGIGDVLSGKTSQVRSKLLSPTEERGLVEKIDKIDKSLKTSGLTDKRKQDLLAQRESTSFLLQSRKIEDLQARRVLLPGTGPEASIETQKREAEILAADFYKTNAELLRQALNEANALETKARGGTKFSQKTIQSLMRQLESGDVSGERTLLNTLSGTTDPKIRKVIDDALRSLFEKYSPEPAPELRDVKTSGINFLQEGRAFIESLKAEISPEDFKIASTAIEKAKDIEAKVKSVIENIILKESDLSKLGLIAEKNRQILTDKQISKELGGPISRELALGRFTQDDLSLLPDNKKNIIKESGLEATQRTRASLEDDVFHEKRYLESLQSEQKKINEEVSKQLQEINSNFNKFFESNKPGSTTGDAAKVSVEQTISAAIDVRGVDQRLLADIKGAVQTVVENSVKNIIKDTFNVVAVTKPATSVA